MIYIGIDPAFRDSGFTIAIIDTEDRTMNFKTFKNGFFDFLSWYFHESPEEAVVCVENSNLQDVNFKVKKELVFSFLRATMSIRVSHAIGAILRLSQYCAKMGRDVGKNQASSQYTCDLCRQKYKVIEVSPAQKGRKLNAQFFAGMLKQEKITPTKNRTNQDDRDAGLLAVIAMKRGFNNRLKK